MRGTRMKNIKIPVDFLSDPYFLALRVFTSDEPYALLGRIISVAVNAAARERLDFQAEEIDAFAGWRGSPSFAFHLYRVGWLIRRLNTGRCILKLPKNLDPFLKSRLGGMARSREARRDPAGRFYFDEKTKPPKVLQGPTKSEETVTVLDADGNALIRT